MSDTINLPYNRPPVVASRSLFEAELKAKQNLSPSSLRGYSDTAPSKYFMIFFTILDSAATKNAYVEYDDPNESRTYYTALDTLTDERLEDFDDIPESPLKYNNILSDSSSDASPVQGNWFMALVIIIDIKYEPDFKTFFELLNQPMTKEYGWTEVYKDETLYVCNHDTCQGSLVYNRFTAKLENVDMDLLFKLFIDLKNRKYIGEGSKEMIIEQLSDYADVMKVERKMPFCISDRENVVFRCYVNNKTHPHLVKKYGLIEREEPYYAIYMRSVHRDDVPVQEGRLRTTTILSGWVIERDPANPKNTLVQAITHTDFKGSIPNWIMSKIVTHMPKKIMGQFVEGYRKFEADQKKI